jgi:hypothetical protein
MKTPVQRKLFGNLVLIIVALFIVGCWTQKDSISIHGDGSIQFTSEVAITPQDFSAKDADELSAEFMKALTGAGWKIERKILTTVPPHWMIFTGSGNLKSVKDAPDFYVLTKINEKQYKIRFIAAERDGNKSSRSITFSKSLFASDAAIADSAGKAVTKIENVDGQNIYTITLD